ncbi:hypothetical protein Thal_0957 [Thermocrinis albus DSM 14484]|uniref:Lipopolysaccharide assembly protein A domain-containing protein n=1 Tax=Thermocrinis albus (strain DSM 14484 / JCM 11386 / HI 11/12) TaxID=638303 RepID=D3SLF9_THEAH|nr:hypothetical protein [Thermocrinis albus]ADC89589.1 hypothetical protein Thal_0957 [Thermocrinis albus DSM 14484]
MRFLLYTWVVFLVLLIMGGLVWLNPTQVELVLTPSWNDVYYRIPPLPLGLLVDVVFLLGLLIGYTVANLTHIGRK